MTSSPHTETAVPLRDVLTLPEEVSASDYVLQLQSGVESAESTVHDYVVTPLLATSFDDALGRVSAAVTSGSDRGVFVHGSFGSGKSHFMAVLDLILRGDPRARSLPGLQEALSKTKNARALDAKLLTVDFHLIGAASFEDAVFSGYLARIQKAHPDERLPILHVSEGLLSDARARRDDNPESFFARLNGGNDAAGSGWGEFASAWDAESFERACEAPVGDPERERLTRDLVSTHFTAYTQAGEWLPIDRGLAVMATHARSLGYDGLVLFLDELVLWLASHLADREFVSKEGSKVAKLVETGVGHRALPIVSFVARQRDLKDFLGEGATAGALGAERLAIGQTFQWWEDRFDKLTIAASDLHEIAHRRLLTPRTSEGAALLSAAVQRLKGSNAWDTLLTDEAGSGEAMFAKVYPFSPALVDTLVGLSSTLQRERTALKAMAQLLRDGRDELTVDDIIPAGDLYDVMVGSGEQPLTDEMKRHYANARTLYQERLRPMLLQHSSLTEDTAASLPRDHPFRREDRLVKTLLIAALVPNVTALRNLTASRLAALNYGSVQTFIAGTEATQVLTTVRRWAQEIGEVHIGEGNDPLIALQLSGVDYDSVLEMVAVEDNESSRRSLLRRMLFSQLGISDPGMLPSVSFPFVWRGSKREVEVVFGNIRDAERMPDDTLRATGETWKVVIDYPFDAGGHGPQEDVNRFAQLRADGVASRTVGWVPMFLTTARQDDLGKLVLLEHLLGGTGDQFERNATHLPVDQRPIAKNMLENQRRALRTKLENALMQAYGLARRDEADIDLSFGDVDTFPTLDPTLMLQPPVAASMGDALRHLSGTLLASQFPDHPRFDPESTEVKRADLGVVLDHVTKAVANGDGRVEPVESAKRAVLRRVANPLGCGQCYENHFAFDAELFPWRLAFLTSAQEEGLTESVPVGRIRAWLAPRGMTKDVQNLLIASWALLDDKQFVKHGAGVQVRRVEEVTDDLELRNPQLPEETDWERASSRAAALFGVTVPRLRSAANVSSLAGAVREQCRAKRDACASVVSELNKHADTLAVEATSPRVVSAELATQLTQRLANETDDVVLVAALGQHPLPDELPPLATAISSAGDVVTALRAATWHVLDAVAQAGGEAEALLANLRQAARFDQSAAPLAPQLREASEAAARYLAQRPVAPTPPSPTPPQPQPSTTPAPAARHVDDITLDGVDDVATQMRDALEQSPGKTLHVEWWLA